MNVQRKVDFHENIIRFFGIAIHEDGKSNVDNYLTFLRNTNLFKYNTY